MASTIAVGALSVSASNLIYNHPNGACIMANYIRHDIASNTCYNSRIGIYLYVSSTTPQTGNISVKNNIIANCSLHQIFIEPGVHGSFDFSDNDYYPDGPAAFNWKGTHFNFAAWQNEAGQDRHSVAADPAFVGPVPSQPLDFVLRPGSPAIGKGADSRSDKDAPPSMTASGRRD